MFQFNLLSCRGLELTPLFRIRLVDIDVSFSYHGRVMTLGLARGVLRCV